MATRSKPAIGITVGDPAGIGPEIARKAAADPRVLDVCTPVLYGPPADESFAIGRVSARAGQAAYDAIVAAVEDATRGRIAAVATAPINKEAFAAARVPWRGHTELLAHLTGAPRVAMMFYSDVLRVVLATVHIPLAEVPRALTRDSLEATIALTASELPRFGWPMPRLALAGLNPHAGEHGLMGLEDDAVLAPAVAASRARGISIEGPLPADTVFVRAMRGNFDAVIAVLSRPGPHPGQAGRVRSRGQRHAGIADCPHLGRSWDGVRHRRSRHRRPVEPRARRVARRATGGLTESAIVESMEATEATEKIHHGETESACRPATGRRGRPRASPSNSVSPW